MKTRILVWKTTETVTILSGDRDGTYRIVWHRADGGDEEFDVTPAGDDTVEEAIAKDLRSRLGP